MRFSLATFRPHVGSTFSVDLGEGQSVVLHLTEAVDRTQANSPGEQFALTFEGPLHPALSQATYALRHDVLGRQEIFLVPMSADGRSRSYEAVFNLISEPS